MTRRLRVALVAGVLLAGAMVGSAQAEWAVDLYGGVAWMQSSDLNVRGTDNNGATVFSTIFSIETDTGFMAGLRGGYWFESWPFLGLGMDLFFYRIPIPAQTTNATGTFSGEFLGEPINVSVAGQVRIPSVDLPGLGFSPELRLRWPLMVSPAFPKGQLQPYIAGGPAWGLSLKNDQGALEIGGKVSAGLAYQFAKYFAVFGEYRYIFFPNFELTDRRITYTADFNNHSLVVGLSLRF